MPDDIWAIALDHVTPREAEVLRIRFGLVDGHTRDNGDVARELGITRIAARQIEMHALQRLMRFAHLRKFASHLQRVSWVMNQEERGGDQFASSERADHAPRTSDPRLGAREPRPRLEAQRAASPPSAPPPEPEPRVIDPALFELAPGALPDHLAASWRIGVEHMTEREAIVLRCRFGLGDGVRRTLGGVARDLGLTRKRAHDLEAHALERLERRAPTRALAQHLERVRAELNQQTEEQPSGEHVQASAPRPPRPTPVPAPVVTPSPSLDQREVRREVLAKPGVVPPPPVRAPNVPISTGTERAPAPAPRPAARVSPAASSAPPASPVSPSPVKSVAETIGVAGVNLALGAIHAVASSVTAEENGVADEPELELFPVPRRSRSIDLEARDALIAAAKALLVARERCKTGPSAKLSGPLLDALVVVERCVEEMLNPSGDDAEI